MDYAVYENQMKRLFLLLLLLQGAILCAQDFRAELTAIYKLDASLMVGIDDFNNIYYITDNILYKKTPQKLFSYSNVELGKLSRVNIHNPFKIILFYADFNSAIILDNNLNELSQQLDFTKETLVNNVLFVTAASQNNIWLFADDNKLHLYDYQLLRETLQTQPITFYDPGFEAENLISNFKNTWIHTADGVLEFNEYGIYIKAYDIKEAEQLFPYQKGFVFLKEGSFFYNDQKQVYTIDLDHETVSKSIYINSSSIFIFDGEQVFEYQIKRWNFH